MMAIQQVTGIAGHVLLASALVVSLSRLGGFQHQAARWYLGAMLAAVTALLLIPVGGGSVAGAMRGVLGDLSITSMILLGVFVFHRLTGRSLLSPRGGESILVCVAVAGMVLYPMTLGLTAADPYRLGFRPLPLLPVLLAIVLYQWRREPAVAYVVLAALVAANLRLLESTNLWDYLLDVWLVLVAWHWSLTTLVKRILPHGNLALAKGRLWR